MEKTIQELAGEIGEHREKALRAFQEGQTIHQTYQAAPQERSLTDEVAAFSEKLDAGIAEMDQVANLRKELISQQSASSPASVD